MFNVCERCGEYRPDKIIDPAGPWAGCPVCGHRHTFRQLPLLIVAGASGAGKTAICRELLGALEGVVLLDADILWRPEFNMPEDNYRDFFETWLRVCKNISQSGQPVLLFGAGMGVPENMEPCVERRYFSTLHYLALTCEDEALAARLRRRPGWRKSGHQAFVDEQIRFNQWFRENGGRIEPAIELLDTTTISIRRAAEQVAAWTRCKLADEGTA